MNVGELYETIESGVTFIVKDVTQTTCTIEALDGSPQILTVPVSYVWERFEYKGRR